MIEALSALFSRDLDRLYQELTMYRNEASIWKTSGQIANSAGNLCLHLIGNLNTYIAHEIGGTGYVRNREAEFSLKDVPREELLQKIKRTSIAVTDALGKLTDASLQEDYPLLLFETKTSMGYVLVHLGTHLTYHLGQISYHRRLLDSDEGQ